MSAYMEAASSIELWGGIECTRNRVGDAWFDQVQWTGHHLRPDDLARFQSLGIRTLRYPMLWEWAAKDRGVAGLDATSFDWSWADDRLPKVKGLGIRPIAGLVHHGSGPSHTSIVDPSFAEGLAAYARELAKRFPWVIDYTPVNEPLTTARFSTLYGHWFPHLRDDRAFAHAMLIQCRATVLAMKAIREIQPAARLVQTEDLGKTYSTPRLTYQAEFDNDRRWLTFDLLSGRVDRHHPFGQYFLWLGVTEDELLWLHKNPCPPDILGVNYYVTSERFLDHEVENYPDRDHGGNGRDFYVDVEAVRVRSEGLAGAAALLEEAWTRYRVPLAITEAHLACGREEQVRWIAEIWQQAQAARRAGVDVRAVTAWSLLGSVDWDSLVTQPRGHYEPGAFDVRASSPRPTAVARVLADLAAGRAPTHPVLSQEGWWRRTERLWRHPTPEMSNDPVGEPLLITGATGTLGSAFGRICKARRLPYRLLSRLEMDIADADLVRLALDMVKPWAVVNAAGYVRVDEAQRDLERCHRENVLGPANLAGECARRGIPLMTFSSDLVFDGQQRQPYTESDPVNPLNQYGRTKAEAEQVVLSLWPNAAVVRTSALFGPWDEYNFVTIALRTLARRDTFTASPTVVSPTYVPDLIHTCLDLLVDGASGIWHLAGRGEVSWGQLAHVAAQKAALDHSLIDVKPPRDRMAPRPAYSALGSERAVLLPSWEDALGRYFNERTVPVAMA